MGSPCGPRHHADRSGPPAPGEHSPGGYRPYGSAGPARRRRIPFHREPGFPPDGIATVPADPQADALGRTSRSTSPSGRSGSAPPGST
ncbi:putative truncated transcriptional regulator [Kitasatospora setae KM-6054]|uniref:Putative truncated transcriptional regulator n=1 Tax=Kitasatospora setae (strain ATCC 33774 / DSM 43861 / JCM 3304 / KCC A-0304 / NBRC 14216 / KM-6054) TaxID=452652 RepID=E4NJH9_KITSK|nr:putative truncated transcriptional regulator [Kitasatospora setae KM-6054]